MPSPETFTASDGTSFPLVPAPYCHYCPMPLKDSFGSWGVCWRCNRRLRDLSLEKPAKSITRLTGSQGPRPPACISRTAPRKGPPAG